MQGDKTMLMRFELRSCLEIERKEIYDYYNEFIENEESCDVLWRLNEISFDEWMKEEEGKTVRFGFYVDGRLVGIGRVTPKPNYEANGKVGYGIRPSERGKLYAPTMIRLIEEYCNSLGIERITACVDVDNLKSIKAFARAGWLPTGVRYKWTEGRTAIELSPRKPI